MADPGGVLCCAVGLAWAGFWTWFAALVAATEGGRSWLYAGSFIAPLWLLAGVAWWKPRLGGLLLIAAGAGVFVYFDNDYTRTALALPATVLGVGLVFAGGRRRAA